jgi:hypothetical protein
MRIYDFLKLKLSLGAVTLQKRGEYRGIPADIECRKPNVYSLKHNSEHRVDLVINNTMHKSSYGCSSRRIKGAGPGSLGHSIASGSQYKNTFRTAELLRYAVLWLVFLSTVSLNILLLWSSYLLLASALNECRYKMYVNTDIHILFIRLKEHLVAVYRA